jgi:hypothetical protein
MHVFVEYSVEEEMRSLVDKRPIEKTDGFVGVERIAPSMTIRAQ